MFIASTVVLAFFATLSTAQIKSIFGVTAACQATILQTINDKASEDVAACINTAGILGIVTSPVGQSYTSKIDSWMAGLCNAAPCSASTLNSLAAVIAKGCALDLLPTYPFIADFNTFLQWGYPAGRRTICLRDTNANNQICQTGYALYLEAALGHPMDYQNAVGSITDVNADVFKQVTLPKSITCGACSQAGYAIVRETRELTAFYGPLVEANFRTTCGNAFVTGGIPPSIIESGVGASPLSSPHFGVGVALTPGDAAQLFRIVLPCIVASLAISAL